MEPIRNIPLSKFLKSETFKGSYIPLTHVGLKMGNIEKIIIKAKHMLQTEGSMALYINDHIFRFDAAKREGFLLTLFDHLKDMGELIELVSADRDCTYAKLKLHPHIPLLIPEQHQGNVLPPIEEGDLSQRIDFNGKVLKVGDDVVHLYGKRLRRATIVKILSHEECTTPDRILVSGIKKSIPSHIIIKQ